MWDAVSGEPALTRNLYTFYTFPLWIQAVKSINKDFTQVAWSVWHVSAHGWRSGSSSWLMLRDLWVTAPERFYIFSWQGRSPHPAFLHPAPLPLHTKYRPWHLLHWIWSCSSPSNTSSIWCPGHASWQLHPTQLCQASIKGNFLHRPQKSRKWLRREVLSWSSVPPNDSEMRTYKNRSCAHWPAPCFSSSAAELAAVWGEFSAISSRGSAGRGVRQDMSPWQSSPHGRENLMTEFPDGDFLLRDNHAAHRKCNPILNTDGGDMAP